MPNVQLSNNQLLRTSSFVNNHWLGSNNKVFDVINPATNHLITSVADAGEKETIDAIAAAETSFTHWKNTTPKERAGILKDWFYLVLKNKEDLATLLTLEQGKPLMEARAEVEYGAGFIEWFAEECKRIYGDVIPSPVADRRMITIKQPIGVVAAITPWNFPIAMITRKIAPAIACGCTVVLKPSSLTPLSALALAYLAAEAGMPEGVLNVIVSSNSREIGKVLTTHPTVKKISFTGSTETGRQLMEQSAGTVKKLSLELGGNAPVIIFNDADINKAVAGTLASKYRNAGQTCVCANRIFVQKDIYPTFLKAYVDAVAKLKVGNGLDEGVNIGPLVNSAAVKKVKTLIDDAIAKGAELVYENEAATGSGCFVRPTIVANWTPEMQMSQEEIFGPVSAIYVFDNVTDAIALANNTIYGLAAYFFTSDINKAWRVAEALEYGIIGINEGIISFPEAPFGGVKQSGFGKEGSYYGIEEYLVTKYLCLGGLEKPAF